MKSERKGINSPAPPLGPAQVLRNRNNAVRHLTALSRDLEARMRTGLAEKQGFASIRASLGPLFFLVWTRPTPITSLARQLGVTKQACSQLANHAEQAGYLERIQSPEDGRSKTLHLTPRGRNLIEQSIEIIRQADTDYAAIVGARRYAKFTKTIAELYKTLDFPADSGLTFLEKTTRTVGTLPLITQRAQHALMDATAAHGHAGLKLSHSQVLPFVGPDGIRIMDLVRIHGASRQAVGATARDLVSLGYLNKEPDPRDRRGAILFLSESGNRLLADSLVELESLEQQIERILGSSVVSEFLDTVAMLESALEVDEDIYDIAAGAVQMSRRHRTGRSDRDSEIQALAEQLHHELGDRRSIRLAELLNQQAAMTAPQPRRLHRARSKQGKIT
jgi:DNA-binding MarR family transcriptional regulator